MSADAPAVLRRRFRIRGVVQGVGYRYFTVEMAERVGVTGWVANEPDGSVLVEAEGTPAAIDAFQDSLRSGPMRARVTGIEIDAVPVTGDRAFRVLRYPAES